MKKELTINQMLTERNMRHLKIKMMKVSIQIKFNNLKTLKN